MNKVLIPRSNEPFPMYIEYIWRGFHLHDYHIEPPYTTVRHAIVEARVIVLPCYDRN